MKSVYFLDGRPAFQGLMGKMKMGFLELSKNNPEATEGISINTTRIAAAAIQSAQEASPDQLAEMIDYDFMPDQGFKDKTKHTGAKFKTVHLPLRMTDYLKAGAAALNIHVLGPREDAELASEKPNPTPHRITHRQYLHLVVLHLSRLPEDYQLMCLVGSDALYPFFMPGADPKK